MHVVNYSKFGIHIKSKDIQKSLEFYSTLGFKPVFVYGPFEFLAKFPGVNNAPEAYRGVTFEVGDALFEVGEKHPAVKPEVFKEEIRNSKVSAMIDVNSIKNLIELCTESNTEIVKGPTVYPWGTTELVIRDPDGFILVFRELKAEYKESLSTQKL